MIRWRFWRKRESNLDYIVIAWRRDLQDEQALRTTLTHLEAGIVKVREQLAAADFDVCSICGRTRTESWHAVGDEPQAVYEAMTNSHDPRVIVTHYWNGVKP